MKDYDILDIVRELQQGNQVILDSLNNTIAQAIEKSNVQVKDTNALSSKDVSALMSFLKSRDRQMGVGTKESRSILDNIEKEMRETIEGGFDISLDAFRAKMDRVYNEMTMKSQKKGEGPLNYYSTKAKSNDEAKEQRKEYSKDLHKENETLFNKLKDFFTRKGNSDDEKGKKVRKNFIADFISELGKVPTFGGALMDLVKLVTYIGASYLKRFGTLGKIIGAALVIFGPALAGMIGKAILGGLARLPFGKTAGAVTLGALAVNEWNNGSKGAGLAFGAASAALVGAMIPALAPYLLPVAVIATGVGLIIKFHKQISNWFKDILKFLGIIAKPSNEISSGGTSLSWQERHNLSPTGSFQAEKGNKKSSEWEKANQAQLKLTPYGAVTNFGNMTKERAWDWMTAYEQAQPETFSKLYKRYNKKNYGDVIDFNSFNTDLSNKDKSEVILGAGVLEDFVKRRDALQKAGYDVSRMKITSGIGTLGNYATKTLSPHNLTGSLQSHNSLLAGTYDTGFVRDKSGKVVSIDTIQKVWEKADLGRLPTAQQEGDHYHLSLQKTKSGAEAAELYAKNSTKLLKIEKDKEKNIEEFNKKIDSQKPEGARTLPLEAASEWTVKKTHEVLENVKAANKSSKYMDKGIDVAGNEFFSKIQQRMDILTKTSVD